MSRARATIEGYMAAAREAEDNLEDVNYQIRTLKRELEKLESKRIGAQQAKRQAHEVMRLALSSQVNDEITAREVEIAAMKGLSLIAGEPLTDEVRARIRNTPALPFFQTV